jgi:hypothetical protein
MGVALRAGETTVERLLEMTKLTPDLALQYIPIRFSWMPSRAQSNHNACCQSVLFGEFSVVSHF